MTLTTTRLDELNEEETKRHQINEDTTAVKIVRKVSNAPVTQAKQKQMT